MERKIGEQFDFLGVKLEVIEGEKILAMVAIFAVRRFAEMRLLQIILVPALILSERIKRM